MTKKMYTWVAVTFVLTLSACILLIVPAINNRISSDKIRLDHLITDKSMKISEAIWIPINQLYTVSAYIERNDGNLDNIEDLAATVVKSEYIRNLIIAPDGVVSQVYPDTEDNRAVIGLDYLENTTEGNREAAIAAANRELLLAGPFTTVVGDKAISGRYPVFLTDENGSKYFWGLISITLKYPEVMSTTNLDSLSEQGYIYELWHINVDTEEREVIMSNGVITEDNNYIDKAIKVLNADWYLRLSPIPEWYQYLETYIYIIISIIFSVLVAVMVQKNMLLRQIKKKLEMMVHYDHLTNLLNRQGLFHNLDIMVKTNKDFIIYFLDLNYFKQINDEYGHALGDKVLAGFARRVSRHIDESMLFARMGGDEFIIIHVVAPTTEEKMNTFWKKVYKEFEKPIATVGKAKIHLTFSKGSARYCVDTDILDDVISKADDQMYIEKRKQHM